MSENPRVILRGLPARTWVVLHFAAYLVLVLAIAGVVALNFLDNAALSFNSDSAVFVWGGFFVVVLAVLVTIVADPVKRRREIRAGYTTLYNSYQFVEQRDPRTGHVVRAAGAPFSDIRDPDGDATLRDAGIDR